MIHNTERIGRSAYYERPARKGRKEEAETETQHRASVSGHDDDAESDSLIFLPGDRRGK